MVVLEPDARRNRGNFAIKASGATVWLEDGQEILNFAAGGLGYATPDVVEAVLEQMGKNPLSTRHFLSRPLAELSQRLAEVSPGDLEVSYFCNSGSEAVEGGLKLARGYHRDRRRFVSLRGAHHGSTLGALSVSGIEEMRTPLTSLPLEAVTAAGISELLDLIDRDTAAVIVEPWPGGGACPMSKQGWLRELSARCEETGALLIADEIRTGMGRSCRLFAVETEGVVPDIVVFGGVLGGGVVPLAGYISRRPINDRVYARRDPTLHASATGGNPAACAAGLATIGLLGSAGFLDQLERKSELFLSGIMGLAAGRGRVIREVRGVGLCVWLRMGSPRLSSSLCERAFKRGLALGRPTMVGGDEVQVLPPLLTSSEEIERGIDVLEAALAGCEGETSDVR